MTTQGITESSSITDESRISGTQVNNIAGTCKVELQEIDTTGPNVTYNSNFIMADHCETEPNSEKNCISLDSHYDTTEKHSSSSHDMSQLQMALTETLVKFCQCNFNFMDFVHFSGHCAFNVDNKEYVHLHFAKIVTSAILNMPKSTDFPQIIDSESTQFPQNRDNSRREYPPKTNSNITEVCQSEQSPFVETEISPDQSSDQRCSTALEGDVDEHGHSGDFDPDDNSDGQTASGANPETPVGCNLLLDDIKKEIQRDGGTENSGGDINTKDCDTSQPEEENTCVGYEDSIGQSPSTRKSRKNAYACDKCSKKFPSMEILQRHVKKHKLFQCPDEQCRALKFFSLGSIRKHFRSVHGKGPKHLHKCSTCKAEFLTRLQLKDHSETAHKHGCQSCDKSFPGGGSLGNHTRHCSKCSNCGLLFNDKKQMLSHKQHCHLELKCLRCDRLFINRAAYNRHQRRHREKDLGKIKCDECDKEFSARASLLEHKRAIHSDIRKYACSECGKEFNYKHSLRFHQLKHSGARPHSCDVCGKSYLTANHLKTHVQAVHSSHKPHKCPMCNKVFPYDYSLKAHVRLHTGERPYMCAICSKTFASMGTLKAHEASHVGTKDFKCDFCDKRFKTKAIMYNHRRLHTPDAQRYMCSVCGRCFLYKSVLEIHARTHSDSRDYKCSVCNVAFNTYSSLYSHSLVHSNDYDFRCTICNKAFKSKGALTSHSVTHSGVKPFKCSICDSCFSDKGTLTKHTKTVHAQSPRFACPVCGKLSNRADNLRVHMKTHGDPELLKLPKEKLYHNAPNVIH